MKTIRRYDLVVADDGHICFVLGMVHQDAPGYEITPCSSTNGAWTEEMRHHVGTIDLATGEFRWFNKGVENLQLWEKEAQ